jgi:hypothetical protein
MMRVPGKVWFGVAAALCASLLIIGCERQPPAGQSKAAMKQVAKDAASQAAKQAADQVAKDAAERAAAEKAAAERTAAQKAAAEKAAAEKVATEKAAAEKAAAEKAAAEKAAEAQKAALAGAVKPPAALEGFQTEIQKGSTQLNSLRVALDALAENPTGDLTARYETFEKELEATKTIADSIRQRKEDMTARGAAYFELWEKQLAEMKTESVKALAEKRREELAENYGAVISATQLTGDAYQAYMAQVKEIHEALDNDLSEATIKGLAPKTKKSAEQAEAVKGRLATVVERLGKIAAIYTGM